MKSHCAHGHPYTKENTLIDTQATRNAQEQRDAFFAWAGRP